MSRSGGEIRTAVEGDRDAYVPVWSPRGGLIAFLASGDVYASTPRGGNLRRLARTKREETHVEFSDNGRQLLVLGTRHLPDEYSIDQILTMRTDGSDRRVRLSSDSLLAHPTWGPWGKIAFIDVWSDLDGGNLVKLDLRDGTSKVLDTPGLAEWSVDW
jgi:Tol biopolymer transport system component